MTRFVRQGGDRRSKSVTHLTQDVDRNVAKHASVDHYRKLSIERLDYADTYRSDNGNRFKTLIIASDLHDIEIDRFYLRVLLDNIKRIQPDGVVFDGDIFDLPE